MNRNQGASIVSRTSPDVVIVGGGIVGTAAAAMLAQAGARVTLIEREGLAAGASGANSGVVQHPFDPILAALYRETVTLYRELSAADLGFRLGDQPAGLLYLSADEVAVRDMDRSLAEAFPDLQREVVTGAALERLEPAVAPGLWACRVGIGFPVHPGASTYAYATLAERRGAHIRLGRSAALDLRGDEVVGVVVDGQPLACDAVLVAAGPWSPELIDPAGRWRPIRHRWGVVVEVELAAGPSHVLEEAEIGAVIGTQLVETSAAGAAGETSAAGAAGKTSAVDVWAAETRAAETPGESDPDEELVDFSLVPLPGVASVGSTFLARQPDPAAWTERILTRATEFVPGVADAPIRGTRSCARPQSADGRPLIGRVPGRRGLYICAGHGAWGISTGPASARLVVDEILGHDPSIPSELDPSRCGAP
jgi:glycine/D-amino acid oxidase-like deaminating enzyme